MLGTYIFLLRKNVEFRFIKEVKSKKILFLLRGTSAQKQMQKFVHLRYTDSTAAAAGFWMIPISIARNSPIFREDYVCDVTVIYVSRNDVTPEKERFITITHAYI